jgi:hypothetical protein
MTSILARQQFGVELECYLPEGRSATELATAINSRVDPDFSCIAESYNRKTVDYWKIVGNGALADPARGIEIVSPILRGPEGLEAVTAVIGVLNEFGCKLSSRCSFHVHVGVGFDAPPQFFKDVLQIYARIEPYVEYAMPGRISTYCRSIAHVTPEALAKANSFQEILQVVSPREYDRRYHTLNIAAYERYSTVEFRQHAGTLNAQRAIGWIICCIATVVAAAKLDKKTAA